MQAAWEQLYGEYCALSGSRQYSYYFDLVRRINTIRIRLTLAYELAQAGEISLLTELGYRGNINQIIAKIKFENIDLQGKQNELESIKSKEKNTGATKEDDFTEWIVSVSKYMGYRIDRKQIMLSEFLAMSKQMSKEIEAKNKRIKK